MGKNIFRIYHLYDYRNSCLENKKNTNQNNNNIIDNSFLYQNRNRINKKVLTTEKILGRWDSMYNSPKSIRVDDYINIDTTIKPKYSISDEFEDTIGSEADINWNIYVLLLLRRYKLININEVLLKFDELIKNKINDKEENDIDEQFDNMDIIGEPNLDF